MIHAKIEQAVELLKELDIDCWMTFIRESATLHDPCIDVVIGGNVTWQSAFIITRSGERIAIVGSLDKAAHVALGFYPEIIPYVEGISDPLVKTLDLRPHVDAHGLRGLLLWLDLAVDGAVVSDSTTAPEGTETATPPHL